MKSIKTKMIIVMCLLVSISLSIVGGTVAVLMYNSSIKSLEKTMTETATIAAELVFEYLETYKTAAIETGLIARLSSSTVPLNEKIEIFDEKVSRYGFLDGNVTSIDGNGLLRSASVGNEDFFKTAMSGKATISNVTHSKTLNKYTFVVAAPLWKDGRNNTSVVGVVYFNVDVQELSDITNAINVGNTGSAYIIDKDNYTIAHKNIQLVLNRDNTAENAKTNPSLSALVKLETKMKAGENGFGTYQYNGVSKLLAYAPIASGQGWSIAVNAELNEFIQSTTTAIIITAILVLLAIIVGVIVAIILARSITTPLIGIEQAAIRMAKGDYDVDISYRSKDEIGSLANSMRTMVTTTKSVILDTMRGLDSIAHGNFNVTPDAEYIGVFEGIAGAMMKIISGLSNILEQIKTSSEQVLTGSDQVSGGAQELAQGATEQASAIEQLSAAISEVSVQIRSNANHAKSANRLTAEASNGLTTSNKQMTELVDAMSKISSSSSQIGKIIKTIEDIAFQTNILALNAAVEAARAGAAGKGFAVVADEVRNLATKSSEAAKQTNVLIESSVQSVKNGVNIANETAQSLSEVVTSAMAVADLVTKISDASEEQSTSISQINLGVEQISAVVQTNSATSEQSAAASEELSAQAVMMKKLVSQFKLNHEFDDKLNN